MRGRETKNMPDLKVHFSKNANTPAATSIDSESGMCVDAEPYALQVLDDSMQPEFRQGCIILIDPSARPQDGSFVLARCLPEDDVDAKFEETDGFVFRQLKRFDNTWTLEALNNRYSSQPVSADLNEIVGVIVQRAGTRRKYLKRYD